MPPRPITTNTLFYGDNLPILREYIADESVDLIYLDPPFNSQANYNVLFRDEKGVASEAQIQAFTDTWKWSAETQATYDELVLRGDTLGQTIESLLTITGKTTPMSAYLVVMAIRLAELYRVLKATGTLWLHCDSAASHYLKIILDSIFGPRNFRNEIVWERSGAHNDANRFGRVTDTILFYTKSNEYTFNTIRVNYSDEHLETRFRYTDATGRKFWPNTCLAPGGRGPRYEWNGHTRNWRFTRENMQELHDRGELYYSANGMPYRKNYLDALPGQAAQNLWTDIKMTKSGAERLGYPTQKPLALLERIISASSNPGDLVLDPFCGCGTTVVAAQKMGRVWAGIDVTHLAIAAVRARLEQAFPGIKYRVIGEPEDIAGARELAESGPEGRYQFQWWALSGIKAMPLGGQIGSKEGKKGADRGMDGQIAFIDDTTNKTKRVIVQVKSGKVNAATVRDLIGTVQAEQAAIGVLLTLEEPTGPMITAAVSEGNYHSPGWNRSYPKIQIISIADMLRGKRVEMPPTHITFKQAPRVQSQPGADQLGLDIE